MMLAHPSPQPSGCLKIAHQEVAGISLQYVSEIMSVLGSASDGKCLPTAGFFGDCVRVTPDASTSTGSFLLLQQIPHPSKLDMKSIRGASRRKPPFMVVVSANICFARVSISVSVTRNTTQRQLARDEQKYSVE